jgi:NAD(P)H dehydrogenase (quinone)
MPILVTGATGSLGRHTIDALLERGIPAGEVAALVRDLAKAEDLSARGIDVRVGSYDEPETLDAALAGVERIVFISGSEVGRRVPQHQNVVDAAVRAGVSLVAYTSIVRADTSPLRLAAEHRATEDMLAAAGLPHVRLRNSWYLENYTAQIPTTLEHGVLLGAAGEGRLNAATRADFAEAAAVVVVEDGHAGKVYELGGDAAFSLSEYAAELASQAGAEVAYQDLPVADYAAALVGVGLDEGYAMALATSDAAIKDGALLVETGDLSRLIGHPTTTMAEAIKAALP